MQKTVSTKHAKMFFFLLYYIWYGQPNEKVKLLATQKAICYSVSRKKVMNSKSTTSQHIHFFLKIVDTKNVDDPLTLNSIQLKDCFINY